LPNIDVCDALAVGCANAAPNDPAVALPNGADDAANALVPNGAADDVAVGAANTDVLGVAAD
jgi:hypothetical protein